MTTAPQPKDPNSPYTLKYDAWNRVVGIQDPSSTTITANEYDGLNRRIIRDESGGSGELRHYYYNTQWQVLVEADPNNVATTMYTYHPHYVDAVAMRIRDADMHVYLHDANFNVTTLVDPNGDDVERYNYTAYGEVVIRVRPEADCDGDWDVDGADGLGCGYTQTWQEQYGTQDGKVVEQSPLDNEYLYTGRRRDPETHLQINRNRFYDPPLGRWVTQDPIEYEGSPWNLYEYLKSRPVNYLDSHGLVGIARVNGKLGGGPCSDRVRWVQWRFSVPGTVKCKGWIVQKVTVKCGFTTKCKCPIEKDGDGFIYYEAWRYDPANGLNFAIDTARFSTKAKRMTYRQKGEIKFFCDDVAARELSKNRWRRRGLPQGRGPCRTSAGGLKNTTETASVLRFWINTPAKSRGRRAFRYSAACCNGGDNVVGSATP